ncbi:MAG: tRNA (N6-isopentenyl adenosine(37)-C2)-methylthiotransferase MiaB [Firmicutes bacterium]|nr:tRNA (N6-isopentenyl adenosine(37)-C2)-methylthiotransferase MiaB [Bacillota bacterium]
MEKIKALNAKKDTAPKFFINTFGCQMNAHDSEKINGMLRQMGYAPADDEKNADFIIYNTCCVRENAENKVYGNLGYLKHAKKDNPDMKIALCGCMMQQPTVIETIRKKYRHVDIVFGTFNLYKLPELIMTNIESGAPVFDIWQKHAEIVEDLPTVRKYKFKASVNIMFGCNNFCSYCIVPYVRGRERSRRPEDIVAEIKALAADGVKEVMLLGQNVNSYGRGLEKETSFAELLRMVNEIEGLKRIRFMTSHPKDLSDELIKAMAECDKVCNHLHLPFQAGSDRILEQMNRRYTKARYLELANKVRRAVPDISLTTDIMVGFPGETEEDVLETIDVVKKVRFASAFTFIYSKRTGTPAAEMENQVPEDVVKGYFNKLLDEVNTVVYEINQSKLGKTYEVLVDDISGGDADFVTGRTTDNTLVHFRGCKDLIGELVNVKITESKPFYLIGEMI